MNFIRLLFLFCSVLLAGGCVMPPAVGLGDQALTAGDTIAAAKYYEEGLARVTDINLRRTVEGKLEQVKGIITENCLANAANALQRGEDRAKAFAEAIAILDECSHWDQNHRIADARKKYQEEFHTFTQGEKQRRKSCENAIAEMKKFFSIYQFDPAVQVIEDALAKYPNDEELTKVQEVVLQGKHLYERMERQLKGGNLLFSLRDFEKLQEISPVDIQFADIPFKYDYTEPIRQKVKNLIENNMWGDASDFIEKWFLPDLQGTLTQVNLGASRFYYTRALQALKTEDYYLAYLLSVKALSYDNQNTGLFDLHKKASDIVDKSIQQYIAIASFDSPSNDLDAGMQFSDSLTSYLYGVLPYGINILERDRIDDILKEKTKSTDSLGKILGADLIVTGRVSLFQVEVNEDLRDVKAKVKTGEVLQENPEYNQMFKLHGNNTATWPTVPPQTITQDQFQIITYRKGYVKLQGFAKASVRIFDTGKAAITFVKDYPASIEEQCEFHDEVPEAGIEFKPKELISVIEAKSSMREKIIAEIGKVVQSSFNAREVRFLNEVNLYRERHEPDKAVIALAKGYFYCLKSNIPEDNQAFTSIRDLVKELIK